VPDLPFAGQEGAIEGQTLLDAFMGKEQGLPLTGHLLSDGV